MEEPRLLGDRDERRTIPAEPRSLRGAELQSAPVDRLCLCITPTFRRHEFLPAAYASFATQTHPRKVWVVVDSSPERASFFDRLDDARVVYVHTPDRQRLHETVPPRLLELSRAHIIACPDELARRVRLLQERESDRIRMPDLDRPTIGECRNLAAAIGRRLFATDDQVVISHKDDDDYYHPRYLETVVRGMADADWVKLKSFLVYVVGGRGRYGRYDYDRRDEPVVLLEGGNETRLDRYVVWADAANRVVAEWGQAAFFGLLFNYTYAALQAAGGFFPLNRAEDIHLYRGMVAPRGPGARRPRIALLDGPAELVCRIAHASSQRTLLHAELAADEVPPDVRVGVERVLDGTRSGDRKAFAPIKPRVLLTNDDGVLSEGMRALYAALSERFEVQVIAPVDEQSGVGHSVSLHAALAHRPLPAALGMQGVALSGTPVDCVKCGMSGVFGPRPDIVVAGMNDGENTGVTLYNSGTASAAREAAIHGLPAFAVSLVRGAPGSLDAYARRAATLVGELLERRGGGVFYNINLPARPPEELGTVRFTRLGATRFADEWEHRPSAGGQATVRLRGGSRQREPSLEYDTGAVAAGHVSVTPVSVDATHTELLALLVGAHDEPATAKIRTAG